MSEQQKNEKKVAAEAAVAEVKSGMTVGLGTGSTAYFAIKKIGDMLADGTLSDIKAVASSDATRKLASELSIPIIPINEVSVVDLTIDGADEFDPDLNLIKGGGGALLQEKIIAFLSRRFLVIADSSKKVEHLGAFKLPLEVMEIAVLPISALLEKKGYKPEIRMAGHERYITDNGNLIIDCAMENINDPGTLHNELINIPGIVETGLFCGMTSMVYMGHEDQVQRFEL